MFTPRMADVTVRVDVYGIAGQEVGIFLTARRPGSQGLQFTRHQRRRPELSSGAGHPQMRRSQGRSQVTSKDKAGVNLYNRAVLSAALIAEAIRRAQNLTSKTQINGEELRRDFEVLNMTDAPGGKSAWQGSRHRSISAAPTTMVTLGSLSCIGTGRSRTQQRLRSSDQEESSTAD
jgi:hypothetical protein